MRACCGARFCCRTHADLGRDSCADTFRCYDFDESGALTVDEMTLSLKSTLTGCAKLTGIKQPPDTLELEEIAQQAFDRADKNSDNMISYAEYQDYCQTNPEVVSWIHYFDDPDEDLEDGDDDEVLQDSELENEGNVRPTSKAMEAARNPELGIEITAEDLAEEEGGDQFMAVRPYLGTVKATVPTNAPQPDVRAPTRTMTLQWVHGYQAQNSRNNLRYLASGDICYHSAGVGIAYNIAGHKQRYNLDHNDDIVSLAMHPQGRFVATGEMGRTPKIVVWDSEDLDGVMDAKVIISGYHKRAVIHLAFSPSGRYLASVGQDDDHCVAIYDWAAKGGPRKVFAEKSHKNKVLAAAWRDDNTLLTCGVKHIFFWDMQSKRKKKGVFGRANGVKMQPLLCAVPLGKSDMVTGTASGHLYQWQGRNCVKAVKAHEGNTGALYSTDEGIASGGKDGKVRLWSHSLEPRAVFDITTFGSVNPSVRSVCWKPEEAKLLVGTMASEIYEFSSTDSENLHGGPLISGHYKEELWGLAIHPSRAEYATVGDDCTIRIWDLRSRKLLRMRKLPDRSRCVAFSPDGATLAVGFGGDVGRGRKKRKGRADGGYEVLSAADLSTIHKAQDSREWISQIKFSPNGQVLAIGSHDNRILLYSTSDFGLLGTCKKHNSYITHFDFSADSLYIQSNCGAYELMYYDANTGEQQTSAPSMKDVEWATQTCTLGWGVQGIWPKCADGTDINAVDRSHDGKTLATVDDFGRLRLFRYPVITQDSMFTDYTGHSSHVMNVAWTVGDTHLITCGGNDRAVFQWKCDQEDDETAEEAKVELDSDDEAFLKDGADIERSARQEAANSGFDMELSLDEEDEGGDQFQAVKPWVGAIVPPTVVPPEDASVPDDELVLNWVHGYRAEDARNNLRYNAAGDIVYTAAQAGITLSVQKWHQNFNLRHTDDVICLALHPDGKLVATGEMGKKPKIVVWDSTTMETVAVIEGLHKRAVCQLAFSDDGKFLASVGQDNDHTCAVYDWKNGSLKAKAKGDKNKTLAVAFAPGGREVCQVGVKHIKFHSFQGRTMKSKKGILGRKGKIQAFLCVEYLDDKALVGTANGCLYLFGGRQVATNVKAHTAAVYALNVSDAGVVTGGKDGFVKIWSRDLAPVSEFDMAATGSIRPLIRSVAMAPGGKKILVGTIASEVWEINARNGMSIHDDGALINGHFKGELWGLATHPTRDEYATVGDDATLRIWDLKTRKMKAHKALDCLARAVSYSPDGAYLAVGLGGDLGKGKQKQSGGFRILRADDLSVQHAGKDARNWISQIKFSPDGRTLAMGSHDRNVWLYDVDGSGEYPLRKAFEKHNAAITHLDFSDDSTYMQTNCQGYELLFADVASVSHIPAASALKDVQWSSWTCTLGWPVQGIWPPFSDGTDINAVDRSHDGRTLATVDDFGKVKLFRYPCYSKKAASKEMTGHSSHVTNVAWTHDDKYVLTTGGNDKCIFQWKTEREEVEGKASYDAADDNAPMDDVVTEELNVFELGKEEEEEGGDQFMAVKPWIGAMHEPTNPPAYNPKKPAINMELEWVYGYRAQDARNNLRYNDAGEIVYTSAAVGIIYDKVRHHQKFYIGHDDDVVCMAVDPSGNFVATGQQGKKPAIHVWDSETGTRLCKLPAWHQRAVIAIAFSPDGKKILSVGQDDNHSVAVWGSPSGSWTDGALVAKCKGDRNKVLFAQFTAGGDFTAVTGGVKHMKFWRLSSSGFTSKRAKFGRKSNTVVSAANLGQKLVTGAVDGKIYVWDGTKISKAVPAHDQAVTALFEHSTGLVSGSKDGQVRLWGPGMDLISAIDLTAARPAPFHPCVRSVCMSNDGSVLLVGTQASEIYEITVVSKKATLLSEAHCKDELWGLSCHPRAPHLAATAGDDKTVRVWNLAEHRMVSKAVVDTMSRAVDWSPDGSMLGCGLGGRVGRARTGKRHGKNSGGVRCALACCCAAVLLCCCAGLRLLGVCLAVNSPACVGCHPVFLQMVVLRSDTMEVVHLGRDAKEQISEVRFSPDAATFAVGSHDNNIYLYDARGGRFELRGKCTKHNSYITHFDFSSDSSTLVSNCGAYELLFCTFRSASVCGGQGVMLTCGVCMWYVPPSVRVSSGDQITDSKSLRDTEWASNTCILGWPVQGIFEPEADGTDVNGVDRSHNGQWVATADDKGMVKVYNYPVLENASSKFVLGKGHSSHVTNCRFNADDSYLLTTGGNDRSVFQWKITPRRS